MVGRGDTGSAQTGLDEWQWQRLTALLLIFLLPWPFVLLLQVVTGQSDFSALAAHLHQPSIRMTHSVLAGLLLLHLYCGVRVIIEDYLHCAALRAPLFGTLIVSLLASLFWFLVLIWGGSSQ